MIPSSVHRELDAEREYQLTKGREGKIPGEAGWSYEFDDSNNIADWASYINIYLGRAVAHGDSPSDCRKNLVKVATLACAALEVLDRNGDFIPRHYGVYVSPEIT